jgi:hypothetical protein
MPTSGIIPIISKYQLQVSCPPFRKTNNRYHKGHYFEMSTTRIIPALSKLPNISKCPPFLKSSHLILLSTAGVPLTSACSTCQREKV